MTAKEQAPVTGRTEQPTIFSESINTEKAPILFIAARLSELEYQIQAGHIDPKEGGWLIMELRQRMAEILEISNHARRMIDKLDNAIMAAEADLFASERFREGLEDADGGRVVL
jgi:hypothetical protein